jgi:hypothetical protein
MDFTNMPAGFKLNQGGSPSPFGDMSNKLQDKSQRLALMLYALGGALKGDKDFVQNTLALQQMQEGKKKQEAQKKKYQDFLAKLPDGSFKDLATALGPSKLDDLLLERYKAEQPKPVSAQELINRQELEALQALRSYGGDEKRFKDEQPGLYAVYERLLKNNPSGLESILNILGSGESLDDPIGIRKT